MTQGALAESECEKVARSPCKNACDEQGRSDPWASRILGKHGEYVERIRLQFPPGCSTAVNSAEGIRCEHATNPECEPNDEYDP